VEIEVVGVGAGEVPLGEDHLVYRSLCAALRQLGADPVPGLRMRCENVIPHARGLGSSSAAIVAGITVARALVEDGDSILDDAAALRLAGEIEGHPDNVAPCLLGGFTIAWTGPDGARAVRLDPHPDVVPVVFVPADRGLTAHARAALPATVPHADAAANAARSALLVHALTADPSLLFIATEDRLHQEYRAPGAPATAALVADLRGRGLAAVVSGAGPSVLALVGPSDLGKVPDTPGWNTLTPGCDPVGATSEVDSLSVGKALPQVRQKD